MVKSVVKNLIILHTPVNVMKSFKVDGTCLVLIDVIGSIIDLYFKIHDNVRDLHHENKSV